MKHLKIHRILKEDKLDEYGNIYSTQFYIKERVSVLGIKYWKSIKRTTGDYGGYTDIIRYFDTIEEAQEYRKKLCKICGAPTTKEVIVIETRCNYKDK